MEHCNKYTKAPADECMSNDQHQRSLTATGLGMTPFGSQAVARFLRPLTEPSFWPHSEFCEVLDFRETKAGVTLERPLKRRSWRQH
jgi:hypothetical protein